MSFVSRTAGAVVVMLLSSLPCAAQRVQGGVKFGIAVSSLSNPSVITEGSDETWRVRADLTFGGFVTLSGNERVAFQPEFLLLPKGAAETVGSESEDSEASLVLRYFEVPLLVRFSLPASGSTSAYLLAGPSLGFKISATVRSGDDSAEDTDVGDRVNGTDFGVTFGAGIQGRRWLLEGRFTQGLRSVAADDVGDAVRTRTVFVLTGLRF